MNSADYTDMFLKSNRPHILMVTNHGIHDWEVRSGLLDTGGQNHYVNALSETLVTLGFKVTTFNRGGFKDPVDGHMREGVIFKGEHQRIVYLEGGGREFIRKENLDNAILSDEAEFACEFLKREGLDVKLIISHYWDAAVLTNMIRQKMSLRAKHVWIPHSLGAMKRKNFEGQPPKIVGPLRFDERIAFEKSALLGIDAVASTSGEISKYLRDFYLREPELFLPPCIDTDLIHPLKKGSSCDGILEFLKKTDPTRAANLKGKKCVLEISRTDRTKRKDIVVEAFAKSKDKHPEGVLLLTISPDFKEVYDGIVSLIEKLGVRDSVIFVGMIPRHLMSELFSFCSVYVTPADQESFGMSIQEAAACGRPAVSSDRVPFATEYLLGENFRTENINTSKGACDLKWGRGAVVVNSGDADGFAYALTTLLSNDKLREDMGREALEITIPEFTWPHLTKRVLTNLSIEIPAHK